MCRFWNKKQYYVEKSVFLFPFPFPKHNARNFVDCDETKAVEILVSLEWTAKTASREIRVPFVVYWFSRTILESVLVAEQIQKKYQKNWRNRKKVNAPWRCPVRCLSVDALLPPLPALFIRVLLNHSCNAIFSLFVLILLMVSSLISFKIANGRIRNSAMQVNSP